MGFSLSSITDKVTSSLKGTGRLADKADPTGVTGIMLSGGLHRGGVAGGMVNKALGKGGSGGGSGAAPQGRKRYQRKERNQWKSKRQLAFEAKKKKKTKQRVMKTASKFGNTAKMIYAGLKK